MIVASVRMSGLHAGASSTVDLIWELFWQEVECCIAVMMVSFITFRTAFVGKSSPRKVRQWYSPRKNIWNRKVNTIDDEHKFDNLPTIPSATLTGMRTFIQGGSETGRANIESGVDEILDRDWLLHPRV